MSNEKKVEKKEVIRIEKRVLNRVKAQAKKARPDIDRANSSVSGLDFFYAQNEVLLLRRVHAAALLMRAYPGLSEVEAWEAVAD